MRRLSIQAKHKTAILIGLLLFAGILGLFLIFQQRQAQCAYIPIVGEELLPNAALIPEKGKNMPTGWERVATGVELRGREFSSDSKQWGFNLSGRSLQLIGIANAVKTPIIEVYPGTYYCFTGRAITDSQKHSSTRIRVVFEWFNSDMAFISQNTSEWQHVTLWTDFSTSDWSHVYTQSIAPKDARYLRISLHPASDDRIYLDIMHVRRILKIDILQNNADMKPISDVQVMPWPRNAKAAVSFTFDWETAMGGLIHTRSSPTDDPHSREDWQVRAMRMRYGITTTLDLFRPYGIRATYYATGYNFLLGNTEKRLFMDNPTYDWASPENGWPKQINEKPWNKRPWFGADPFSTFQKAPMWYFGDLIPRLQAEKQDVQSHTFAHFSGTYVKKTDWQADFDTWRAVARQQGISPPRSLAFPWSSSNGMSDDDWNTLAANGITSVTRLHWSQAKSTLFTRDRVAADGIVMEPHCQPIPGHESILGCPDFYLHDGSALTATQQIDQAIATGGMIDVWAHTEEVTSPSQMMTWTQVVRYAAAKRDRGELWIAPLSDIADWQQACALLELKTSEKEASNHQKTILIQVNNKSLHNLSGLTIKMPMEIQSATINENKLQVIDGRFIVLDSPAQQVVNILVSAVQRS